MSKTDASPLQIDKQQLVTFVEDPKEKYIFHNGEGFRKEVLPIGTRVIYPPPPFLPLDDAELAIEEALENPLGCDPLSAQLRSGMKITIAFDDVSVPLPPMQAPDVRQQIVENVVSKLTKSGITDIHIVAALGLHRRMSPSEMKRALGPRIFSEFHPDNFYNHDAEDKDNFVEVGKTSMGEVVELPKRVMDSDLVIYVNVNLVAMDGGHKSITTGLTTYRTLRHHHNVHTLMHSKSYMDPPNSALHHSCNRMGTLLEKEVNVFKIETTLNTNTFPAFLGYLQKPERTWNALDRVMFNFNMRSLKLMPFAMKHKIFHAIRAPYGLTGVAAGATEPVHEHTLKNLYQQQAVTVDGQSDVMVVGLPYLSPYNVNSFLNPILVHCNALGYIFNLYRGKPLVRKGGVLILFHPLEYRFHSKHHPSYIDFFEQVLPNTRDPQEMERRYEADFATDPRYIDMYRNSQAYHGVHPFYMWYWASYGQSYLGRVIVVGARDGKVADTLGYQTAHSLEAALEMAHNTVGPSPKVTAFHMPPIFIADVK